MFKSLKKTNPFTISTSTSTSNGVRPCWETGKAAVGKTLLRGFLECLWSLGAAYGGTGALFRVPPHSAGWSLPHVFPPTDGGIYWLNSSAFSNSCYNHLLRLSWGEHAKKKKATCEPFSRVPQRASRMWPVALQRNMWFLLSPPSLI